MPTKENAYNAYNAYNQKIKAFLSFVRLIALSPHRFMGEPPFAPTIFLIVVFSL
jgi:hypothetical protein